MAENVNQFLQKSFRLISATAPSVPLRGEDYLTGLEIMNDLLSSYGINGFLQPLGKIIELPINAYQKDIIFSDELTMPDADYTDGRLVSCQNAWIVYQGVVYPLTRVTRTRFNSTARFDPQSGLPLNYILFNEDDYTALRLWPAPVENYILGIDGQIQPSSLSSGLAIPQWPQYYTLFFKYAVAREMSLGMNRDSAWSDKLEARYLDLERIMQNNSPRNLDIGRTQNMLNGATLVASGLFLYDY